MKSTPLQYKRSYPRIVILSLCAILALLCSSCSFWKNVVSVEKANYTVIEEEKKFELRRYDPQLLAETLVEGEFENVGNQAFRRLFGYISGDNTTSGKIAMTAPVSQESGQEKIAMTAPVSQEAVGKAWRIAFMMPSEYTSKTLPTPTNSQVKIREIPASTKAAIRYSGSWSQEGYKKNEQLLLDWIKEKNWRVVSKPTWARYNPPFTPSFLRRNEVLVTVEKK